MNPAPLQLEIDPIFFPLNVAIRAQSECRMPEIKFWIMLGNGKPAIYF